MTEPLCLIVYSKGDCAGCIATRRWLESRAVPFVSLSYDTSPEAAKLAAEKGYRSAPIVVHGAQSWCGFRPDRLAGILSAAPQMNVEFEEITPDEWRILADGKPVGLIGADASLGGLWLAEWRNTHLEYASLGEAMTYTAALIQDAERGRE